MVPLVPDPKRKSHIQKPEDFTDTKQWDKFKRQSFVYLEENRRYFPDEEMVIQFLLSFMVGGLPEKFAANFINDLTDDLQRRKENARDLGLPAPMRPNWGSIDDFELILEVPLGTRTRRPMQRISSPCYDKELERRKSTSKSLTSWSEPLDTRGTTTMSLWGTCTSK
jgi:hypothetical protein